MLRAHFRGIAFTDYPVACCVPARKFGETCIRSSPLDIAGQLPLDAAASEQNVDHGVEDLNTGIDWRSKSIGGPWESQEEVVVKILRSGGVEQEEEEGRGCRHRSS